MTFCMPIALIVLFVVALPADGFPADSEETKVPDQPKGGSHTSTDSDEDNVDDTEDSQFDEESETQKKETKDNKRKKNKQDKHEGEEENYSQANKKRNKQRHGDKGIKNDRITTKHTKEKPRSKVRADRGRKRDNQIPQNPFASKLNMQPSSGERKGAPMNRNKFGAILIDPGTGIHAGYEDKIVLNKEEAKAMVSMPKRLIKRWIEAGKRSRQTREL